MRFRGGGCGAVEAGFRGPSPSVWVHTCSLNHPAAQGNYQARGMSIGKIETPDSATSSVRA